MSSSSDQNDLPGQDPKEQAFSPPSQPKKGPNRGTARFDLADVALSVPVVTVSAGGTSERLAMRRASVLVAQQIHEAREAKKKDEEPVKPTAYMNESSFFIFSATNPLRRALFRFVHWRWFRIVVVLIILINMGVLAAYDPTNLVGLNHLSSRSSSASPVAAAPVEAAPIDLNSTAPTLAAPLGAPVDLAPVEPPIDAPVDPASLDPVPVYTTRNYVLDIIDLICLLVYTIEVLLKMFVMGAFLHKGSFFRNGWNILDFLIVVTSWIGLGVGPALGVFKIARVFRPLRLLNMIKQLRQMVNAMVRSIPYLFNVILLMLLFFILFGLTGVELWGGAVQRHCYDNSTGVPELISVDTACRVNDGPSWLGGYYCDVEKQQVCGRSGQNPNNGMTHFDNFGAAILALFQSVTLEGWIFITYWMQDAAVDVAALYFVLIPILGAFFFVNLFLATMQDSYSRSSDALDADDDDALNEDGEPIQEDDTKPGVTTRFLNWLKRPESDDLPNVAGIRGSLLRFADSNVKNVLERGWFQNIREVLILLNSIALGIKYYDMNPSALSILRTINLVFLIIFSVEVFYHLVARGLYNFVVKDNLNLWDAAVIILGWVQYGATGGQIVGAFVVFRLFRVLRLFSYIKSWRKVNKVTAVVPKVLPFLFYSLVLMAVVIFIFAVLGMQLLGGKYTASKFPEKPRLHYDSFWVAFVSTFCVVTFENWNGQMYDAVKASGSPAIALYFVAIIFAGNYIILNLFLSILLNAFGDALEDEEEAEVFSKDLWGEGEDKKDEEDEKPAMDVKEDTATELNVLDVTGKFIPTMATKGVASKKTIRGRQYDYVELDRGFATLGGKQKLGKIYDKSLFIFGTSSAIRRYLFYLTTSKIFIYTMNTLILLSLVTLMVESYFPSAPVPPAEPPVAPPFPDNSTAPVDLAPLTNETVPVGAPFYAPPPRFLSALSNYNRVRSFLYAVDIVYTVLFALEAIMKIIAQGFVMHPRSYMRNFVNVFDLVAEIIMIIDVATWSRGIKIIKLLRFTRPVRLLFRLKQTRIMFVLFYRTLPNLPSVLPIGLIIWFTFAIMGTQLYAGKFRSCNDDTILTRELCNGTFINDEGVETARDWEAPNDNYDHFFQGVFTIFKKSTGEGWPDVMFAGIDAPERVDTAPVRGRDPLSTVFFIAQVGFTAWFVLGLVFGAIVDTFNDLRKDHVISKHAGELLITDEQRQWVELQTMMVGTLPRKFREPPSNAFQRFFHRIAVSKAFEYTMLVIIGLNTFLLCFNIYVQTENQDSNPWRTSQRYADFIFTSIYIVELLINLIAFGRYFFYDGWHILDFVIVIVSVVGWFVTFANLGKTFRVLRTLRIFKVTKSIKTLRILWRTMLRSLPAILNVFLLLFLTFCAFAEVGVVLFRDLPDGDELSRRANFNTFWSALLLLLRCATGEAWDTIMHDIMKATSNWACIYFILFVVLINFIFLNVFTAVVVDSFQSVAAVDEHEVTIDDIEKFTDVWSEFDRQAVGRIHVKDLPNLIARLGKPLGLKKSATEKEVATFVQSLHMPVVRHHLYFPEVLLMLSQKAVGVDRLPPEVVVSVARKWNKNFQKRERRTTADFTRVASLGVPLQEYERPPTRTFTLREVLAAITIQRAFRAKAIKAARPRRSTGGFVKAKPTDKSRVTSEMEADSGRKTKRSTENDDE